MTKAQLLDSLAEALERIAELEQGAPALAEALRKVEKLEREAIDAEEIQAELNEALNKVENEPGQILADRLRELLADLTIFPERDVPDFYNALDAYDVAKARLS